VNYNVDFFIFQIFLDYYELRVKNYKIGQIITEGFSLTESFRPHCAHGVDSAYNRDLSGE
jgi:hypothetical protein